MAGKEDLNQSHIEGSGNKDDTRNKEIAKQEVIIDKVFGNKKNQSGKESEYTHQQTIAKQEIVLDNVFSLFGSVVNQNKKDDEPRRRSKSSSKRKAKGSISRSESVPTPQQSRLKKKQLSVEVPRVHTMLSQSDTNLSKVKDNQHLDNVRSNYEKGGPMPDEVRDMIGNTTKLPPKQAVPRTLPKIRISKSPQTSPYRSSSVLSNTSYKTRMHSPEISSKLTTIKRDKKREQLTFNESRSLKEKFEQQKKRDIIDDFLSNPKPNLQDLILSPKSPKKRNLTFPKTDRGKAKDVIDVLEQTITEKSNQLKTGEEVRLEVKAATESYNDTKHKNRIDKPKVDLFKVVLASAAAEVVNLKSKEEVPSPTAEEIGKKAAKKVMMLCRKGDWNAAGEVLKDLEAMMSQKVIDKSVIDSCSDPITGNTLLMYSTIENKLEFITRFANLGTQINATNVEKYTAIHFAAMYSREDTLSLLLTKKANPNLTGGPMNQNCLHLASARMSGQSASIVELLLSHCKKETRLQVDSTGNIPLFCAIESGNSNVVLKLLKSQADKQVTMTKDPVGDTAMHLATRKRDSDMCKTLVEAGSQVDVQNTEGQTPLHLACLYGCADIVRVLFLARANASIVDKEDKAPIYLAAERGHTLIVEFLIDKFKASVFERAKDGSTLMHIAAQNGHPETATALFDRGVPLLMPNKFGERSIHTAAKAGHTSVLKAVIKKGENVNARTGENMSALHIAVENGQSRAVETLLGYGADVTMRGGKDDETALHIAARIDEAKGERCTKQLVKSGADPNAPMSDGRSSVHIAAAAGNLLVLRALLQNGGDAQMSDKDGETALHKAAKNCHFAIVKELLQFIQGFIGRCTEFVNKKNNKGETALHYAAMISKNLLHFPDEDKLILSMLMDNGSDVTVLTELNKESAFHYVSLSGNIELLKEILANANIGQIQISVNKQNTLGWAPLLAASSRGHIEIVASLLECNARVDVFDNEGRSALHLAAECGSMDVCKLLLDKNAFVNSKTKLGWTALHFAAHKGYTDLAAYLIKSGATLDGMTIKKQTPLHLAAAAGQKATCQKLLELEATVDSNDDQEQKPIHLAAQHDHNHLVQLFLETRPSLVSSTTKDGNTLAHLAAKKGSTDVLKAMFAVDKSLVTNAKNRFNGNSPLHLATEGGHIECVRLMLENGVSPTDENNDGFTPVHIAAKCGHADIFDIFAKSGVSLKQPSSKIGMTALHIASYFGEEEITRELFKHIPAYIATTMPTKPENALIEELCYESDLTPLHLASYSGSENVVRAILNQSGVDVGIPSNPSGYSSLHLACLSGHVGVVGLLLSRSTDLLKNKDSVGRTSLHVAAANGHNEMCLVLLGQGAEYEVQDNEQWTPLHLAAKGGFLDIVSLLVSSGADTMASTNEGKIPLWYACIENNKNVVEFMFRKPHDTYDLLEDEKFIYNLMKMAKMDNQKSIEDFIFVAPAPADVAAKLSNLYRDMAETEKERADDLLEAADYCENLAKDMVILASHIESPGTILNAVDMKNHQYIDILIENEQKIVISEYVVQVYLQEIWEGQLNWPTWKMLGFFFLFVVFPPVWFFFSLPINFRMNKIPVIKFMSYLTSHIYFMLFLSLTSVAPPHVTVRESLIPHWYEIVTVIWYTGQLLAEFTNPGAKGGLSWVKTLNVILGIFAMIVHISAIFVDPYHWSLLMYIRNQFMGMTLLMCAVQILDFLAFHPLFGPWAIIIGECLKDVGKFVVVLSLFVVGYALLGTTMNQPFGNPNDYINDKALNPKNLTQKALFEDMVEEEGVQPFLIFEILFFALFGITSYDDMKVSKYVQPWTYYMFKAVFATYLTMTIIVLINLLIAMMSDTYCRIQEQSDIEWKFGLAKLIRNMQRTNVAPSPLNLFTTWLVLVRKQFLEMQADRQRAKMKFRRAMREEIMQKAPGMRFVVEERDKSKKKKKKPRVIHALGNIKWGFTPRGRKVEAIDTLQTKWDREHDIKMKENATFGSNESLDEYRMLSKIIPWTAVIRSYMESKGRGAELKPQNGEENDKAVKDIMKSISNVRNDRSKKEQAKKWSNMPAETKTKVITKWEEKAKVS